MILDPTQLEELYGRIRRRQTSWRDADDLAGHITWLEERAATAEAHAQANMRKADELTRQLASVPVRGTVDSATGLITYTETPSYLEPGVYLVETLVTRRSTDPGTRAWTETAQQTWTGGEL